MAELLIDRGPVEVKWVYTENDTMTERFRIKDPAGNYIADPEGAGWVMFGQVRDKRGGAILGDVAFTFDGAWVEQALPALGDGHHWLEIQLTNPDTETRTTISGVLRVIVDSAEEGS